MIKITVPLPTLTGRSASGGARSAVWVARYELLGLGCSGFRPRLRLPPALHQGSLGCAALWPGRGPRRSLLSATNCLQLLSLQKRGLPVVLLQPVVQLALLLRERVEPALELRDLDVAHHAYLRAAVAGQPEAAAE